MPQTYISAIPSMGDDKDRVHKTTWNFKNSGFSINYILEIHKHQETVTIKMNDIVEIPSITREYVTRFTLAGDTFLVTPPTKFHTHFRLYRNGYDVINNDEFNFTKDGYFKSKVLEVISCVLVVGIPYILYKESVMNKNECIIEVLNDKVIECGLNRRPRSPTPEKEEQEQQPQEPEIHPHLLFHLQYQQQQQQLLLQQQQLQLQQQQLQQQQIQQQHQQPQQVQI
ncbi:hypothetical protein RB653_006413 [Dictyostelium firmibasis]|uniref:Uncharacterized protein n=1 Tax=Dictyostelium firmibasis TaxID=79012 RepID=A0AAN7Z055_9MYCE